MKILWQRGLQRLGAAQPLCWRAREVAFMRRRRDLWFALSLLVLVALAGLRASDRDETILTVQVSSAEHEVAEGYFSLGDTATVMAKPGTDLYRFLSRQRGRSSRSRSQKTPAGSSRRIDNGALSQRSVPGARSPGRRCCSGVEAPAVRPTVSVAGRRQPAELRPLPAPASVDGAPTGPVPDLVGRDAGSPGRRCGTCGTRSAQIRARLQVLLLL